MKEKMIGMASIWYKLACKWIMQGGMAKVVLGEVHMLLLIVLGPHYKHRHVVCRSERLGSNGGAVLHMMVHSGGQPHYHAPLAGSPQTDPLETCR